MRPVTRCRFFGVWLVSALIVLPCSLAAQGDFGGGGPDIIGIGGCRIEPIIPAPGEHLCLCEVRDFEGNVDQIPTEYVRFRVLPQGEPHPDTVKVKVVIFDFEVARFANGAFSDTWENPAVPCPSDEIAIPILFRLPGFSWLEFYVNDQLQEFPVDPEVRSTRYSAKGEFDQYIPAVSSARPPSKAGTIDIMMREGHIQGRSITSSAFRSYADAHFEASHNAPAVVVWQTSERALFWLESEGPYCGDPNLLPVKLTYSQKSDVSLQVSDNMLEYSGSGAWYGTFFEGDFPGFPGVQGEGAALTTGNGSGKKGSGKQAHPPVKVLPASSLGATVEQVVFLAPDVMHSITTHFVAKATAATTGDASCRFDADGVTIGLQVLACPQ